VGRGSLKSLTLDNNLISDAAGLEVFFFTLKPRVE